MKTTLKLEEVAQLALGIFVYSQLHQPLWLFFALILTPDIGFAGYAFGNKVGAAAYNILHHKGIAIAVAALGYFYGYPSVLLAGTILFTHSAFDRLMGYGLKYTTGFDYTHLGLIGKAAKQEKKSVQQA